MNQVIALLEEKRGCHAVNRTLLFAEKGCHALRSVLLRKERCRHAVDRALLFAEKGCHASRSVLLRKERGYHAVDRVLWDKKKHGLRSWMVHKDFASVDEFRGMLALPVDIDAEQYERQGYVVALEQAKARYGSLAGL